MTAIKNDELFQTLLRYDSFLVRGDMSSSSFLATHLGSYCKEVDRALAGCNLFLENGNLALVVNQIVRLKDICATIVESLRLYEQGHIAKAMNLVVDLLEEHAEDMLGRQFCRNDCRLFRIRSGDHRARDNGQNEQRKSRTKLFHISMNEREKISSCRFSLAGTPCLYLSTGLELAWYECGMPNKFSYCRFKLSEESESLKLFDLSERPAAFLSSLVNPILNYQRQGKVHEQAYQAIARYILTYPIVAACSLRVRDRECNYVEEYAFPQMLMQWVRQSDVFDGVQYRSARYTSLVEGVCAVNIALPVKQFREDGLDEKLTSSLEASEVAYFEVSSMFDGKAKVIDGVKKLRRDLQLEIVRLPGCNGEFLLRLIEGCEYVLSVVEAVMENSYENGALLFTQMNALSDYIRLIKSAKETLIAKSLARAEHENGPGLTQEDHESYIDRFVSLSDELIEKNCAFMFATEASENFMML